uniref:glucomannan 4-beta-mannosyltransferase n=1 Tax=Oryza glaberrima TaxID=4538 RepID=I1P800_ORYGL
MEGQWGRWRLAAAAAASSSGDQIAAAWAVVRARAVAPVLQFAVWACMAMSVMLVLEVAYMSLVSLVAVKLLRRVPERRYKWEPITTGSGGVGGGDGEDEEAATGGREAAAFPMVLVQIPMYNEKEVYKLSIGAACALTWPPDRIIIQVLDDSTDPAIKDLVELECKDWARKEINIKYEIRDNRKGYKAGALKKGMEHIYTQQCDFVAIFDADFQPESDFLLKTIPFLVHNPKIGLVQTRWEFVNYDVCLMTRIQKMSLDYHFKVEQESGSSMHSFFGFNGKIQYQNYLHELFMPGPNIADLPTGTAGVWRVSAINEAGGWKDRTTVEDMDLAVRASLKGWQFLLRVNSQVPSKPTDISSIDGLVVLPTSSEKWQRKLPKTRQAFFNDRMEHVTGLSCNNFFTRLYVIQGVSVWKKLHLLYSFFFVRRVVAPILTFLFYCVVIPLSVMVPEVSIPVWGMVYIPTAITIMNAIRNPGSIHLMPFWILFENVMAMHRMRAALTGLLETMNVNQWVVTEKVGDHVKDKLEVPLLEPLKPTDCVERIYIPELMVAFYLLVCASYDLVLGAKHYYLYIYLQAFAFIALGFGFAGTSTPCS